MDHPRDESRLGSQFSTAAATARFFKRDWKNDKRFFFKICPQKGAACEVVSESTVPEDEVAFSE